MNTEFMSSWAFWAVLSAVFAALTAVAFLAERLAPLQWVGVLLVGTGALLLATG